MKRIAYLLIVLALFAACSAQGEAEKAEQAVELPPSPETEQQVEVEAETPEEEQKENIVTLRQEGEQTLLSRNQSGTIDGLCLQGSFSTGSVRILDDEEEIYCQENASPKRWCYLGPLTSTELTVRVEQNEQLTAVSLSQPTGTTKAKVSAYLPYNAYRQEILSEGLLDVVDELTVNVGCYWLADGTLDVADGLYETFRDIQQAYPNIKLSCTINPRNGAATAVMTAEGRQKLVQSMKTFCLEWSLSGVDIDWEFPAEGQWDEFSLLIEELSAVLADEGKTVSLAFYPQGIRLSEEAIQGIHKVHVMAYDQFDGQGQHATYETAVDAIDYFCDMGFQSEQLSLGIPAYGRPLNGEARWLLYCDYAHLLNSGENQWEDSYFNSVQLAQDKALLAREEGLQGIFLYHLACDSQDDTSLLKACAEVLHAD